MPSIVNRKASSNSSRKEERSWRFDRVMTNFDSFSMEVPSFNIRGETRVRTLCGSIVTFIILALTISFAVHTSLELVEPQNPSISEVTTPNYFGNDDQIRLDEVNFKMAFSFYDFSGHKVLNDTRYIQWFASLHN